MYRSVLLYIYTSTTHLMKKIKFPSNVKLGLDVGAASERRILQQTSKNDMMIMYIYILYTSRWFRMKRYVVQRCGIRFSASISLSLILAQLSSRRVARLFFQNPLPPGQRPHSLPPLSSCTRSSRLFNEAPELGGGWAGGGGGGEIAPRVGRCARAISMLNKHLFQREERERRPHLCTSKRASYS